MRSRSVLRPRGLSAQLEACSGAHSIQTGPKTTLRAHWYPSASRSYSRASIGRMGILSRVEGFLERLFEAPAGRLGARLQPVSLAKRIERAMDTNKTFGDAGVIVPNQYDLHLHPSDYASFESYRGSLEDDLAHGVISHARHERYS